MPPRRVKAGQNHGIQHCLGVTRFDFLPGAVDGIVVKRKDIFPDADALFDAFHHSRLRGRRVSANLVVKYRPSQRERRLRVAGDAVGAVIFLCPIPALPPHFAAVEIARGCLAVPVGSDWRWSEGRRIFVRSSRERNWRQNRSGKKSDQDRGRQRWPYPHAEGPPRASACTGTTGIGWFSFEDSAARGATED